MSVMDSIFKSTDEMDMKQKIVEELLNSEHNLETKTEMGKPLRWACLNTVEEFIATKKLPESAKILKGFMETSFKYLISNDRKGRAEYIQALQSLAKMEDKKVETSLMKA